MVIGCTEPTLTKWTEWCEPCGDYVCLVGELVDHDQTDVAWVVANPVCERCGGSLIESEGQ